MLKRTKNLQPKDVDNSSHYSCVILYKAMPTPDADEGTEIESSTCYNGVLSRVYNRFKVNV